MKTRQFVLTTLSTAALTLIACYTTVFADNQQQPHALSGSALAQHVEALEIKRITHPEDYEILKALGIAYHFQAAQGLNAAIPRAVTILETALAKSPAHFETMCYLGSAQTMMAKTTWNPLKKMAHVNKGTALMDRAVKRAPDNIAVRMTRGANALQLPSFLNRVGCAVEDYSYLADLIQQHPLELAGIKAQVDSGLAEALSRHKKTAGNSQTGGEQTK